MFRKLFTLSSAEKMFGTMGERDFLLTKYAKVITPQVLPNVKYITNTTDRERDTVALYVFYFVAMTTVRDGFDEFLNEVGDDGDTVGTKTDM